MAQAVPEGFNGLTRQNASRCIGHGARDDDRQAFTRVFEQLFQCEQRRFGIQRVKNGFDEKNIRTTLHEPFGLVIVGFVQLFKAHIARTRVVDFGGNAGGFRRGTDRAGDEAWFVGRAVFIAFNARQTC